SRRRIDRRTNHHAPKQHDRHQGVQDQRELPELPVVHPLHSPAASPSTATSIPCLRSSATTCSKPFSPCSKVTAVPSARYRSKPSISSRDRSLRRYSMRKTCARFTTQ